MHLRCSLCSTGISIQIPYRYEYLNKRYRKSPNLFLTLFLQLQENKTANKFHLVLAHRLQSLSPNVAPSDIWRPAKVFGPRQTTDNPPNS